MKVTPEMMEKAIADAEAANKALEDAIAKKKELEDLTQNSTASGSLKGNSVSKGRASSLEAKALTYFGVNHPAQLIHVNTADNRFKGVPEEVKSVVVNLKNAVDTSRMIAQMFHGAPQDKIGKSEAQDRIASVKSIMDSNYAKDELKGRLMSFGVSEKAFGSTTVGGGAEWVPQLISSNFIEEWQLKRVVADKFRVINMPSAVYDLPVQKNVTKARKIGQGATITAANFGTDKLRFTATKIGEYYELPDELDQDSAPDIFALAKSELMEAQKRAEEYAIIRGSTAGVHYDSDTAAAPADVAEKLWDGLVRIALANSANGSTADFGNTIATEALLRELRASMKKFAVNPADVVMFVGPAVYSQLVQLPSVITIDKMGPLATVMSGTLAMYAGISIVVSEAMREDLNASGVYDGVTTDRASIVMANVRRHYVGERRAIKMKLQESLPNSDQWLMASYQRKDFQSHPQTATELSAVLGYNLAL